MFSVLFYVFHRNHNNTYPVLDETFIINHSVRRTGSWPYPTSFT